MTAAAGENGSIDTTSFAAQYGYQYLFDASTKHLLIKDSTGTTKTDITPTPNTATAQFT